MFTRETRDLLHILAQRMGGTYTDPRWLPPHRRERGFETLKQFVRDHWPQRKDFPAWIMEHVREWSNGNESHASRSAIESTEPATSRAEVEEGSVRVHQ